MKVLQFPLAKITIGFITGILVAYYFKPTIPLVFSFLFVAASSFIVAFFVSKKKDINPIYFGLTTYFLAFGIGASTQIIHTDSFQSSNYTRSKAAFENPHLVSFTIREKLRSSSFNDRYIVLVNQIDDSLKTGRILLNIRKDSLNHSFEIGTHLQIKGSLYQNSTAKNPNQFDYGNYLESKQIYAQLYADASDIKIGSIIEKDVWYYEHRLPEGQKAYNKTRPIQAKEFDPIKDWWHNRQESDVCWKVNIHTIAENGYNLDIKNPTKKEEAHEYNSAELMEMLHTSFEKSNFLLEQLKEAVK